MLCDVLSFQKDSSNNRYVWEQLAYRVTTKRHRVLATISKIRSLATGVTRADATDGNRATTSQRYYRHGERRTGTGRRKAYNNGTNYDYIRFSKKSKFMIAMGLSYIYYVYKYATSHFWNVTSFLEILQSALLDLLGTTDVTATVMPPAVTNKNSSPNSTAVTHNNDLLDLLGSLDLNSPTSTTSTLPLQPQTSSTSSMLFSSTDNFLVDGLLSTPTAQNGSLPRFRV